MFKQVMAIGSCRDHHSFLGDFPTMSLGMLFLHFPADSLGITMLDSASTASLPQPRYIHKDILKELDSN